MTDPLTLSRRTEYDAYGRVLRQTDALNHTTEYRYNDAERSLTSHHARGRDLKTTRNRHGETVSITDGRGNTDTFVYSRNGKLIRQTNAAGEATVYMYDNADRICSSPGMRASAIRVTPTTRPTAC